MLERKSLQRFLLLACTFNVLVAAKSPLEECITTIENLDSIKEFTEIFVPIFNTQLKHSLNQKELGDCLNTLNTFPSDSVADVKSIIELGETHDVCDYEYYITRRLGRYHTFRMARETEDRLRRIFSYYVSKVMSSCIEALPERINEAEQDKDFQSGLRAIDDLIEKTSAICDNGSISNSLSLKNSSLYNKLASDRIELLLADDQIYDKDRKVPTIVIPYSPVVMVNLSNIRRSCRQTYKYQRDTIYSIQYLTRRDYMSPMFYNSYRSANVGPQLAVAQMCEILKLIQVETLNDEQDIRFKMISRSFDSVHREFNARLIEWPALFRSHKYSKEVNIVDLADSIRDSSAHSIWSYVWSWLCPSNSLCKHRERNKRIKSIRKTVYNNKFLQAFVQYLATKDTQSIQ